MKLLLGMGILSFSVFASTIAIIDSGVDNLHTDLQDRMWINAGEIANNGRDEDGNGYQDDVHGWNFAEQNNKIIERKYLGTFSEDPRTFFAIQGRSFLGTATQEDRDWVAAKRVDKDFMKEMQIFGNFVHGTHVAGITARDNNSEILAVKLIPTEVGLGVVQAQELVNSTEWFALASGNTRMKLLKSALDQLANQQMLLMEEIAFYINGHNVDVANGSFGTGFDQSKMITNTLFKVFFFRKPTEEESYEVTSHFMNSLIKYGKTMVDSAKDTLFVFAAGNSGTDNDKFPTSPTNVQADNVISVAATYKYNYLAPFSCYGEKTVDVAAPGMLINSQIPGDEYLEVSGTSQAAPYVANVASQIKDANPELSPLEIKKVLMGTVDVKEYLDLKVLSKGIVNLDRAIYAAKLSHKMNLSEAISDSKRSIQDVKVETINELDYKNAQSVIPMAMPSLFR